MILKIALAVYDSMTKNQVMMKKNENIIGRSAPSEPAKNQIAVQTKAIPQAYPKCLDRDSIRYITDRSHNDWHIDSFFILGKSFILILLLRSGDVWRFG